MQQSSGGVAGRWVINITVEFFWWGGKSRSLTVLSFCLLVFCYAVKIQISQCKV